MGAKIDLSQLPLHIREVNKKWFVNSKTGAYIKRQNIQKYIPKPVKVVESWMAKYDNY